MAYVIGLDVGGTKITGVVYDGKTIVDQLTIVTPKNLFEFKRNVLKLISFLSAKYKISAIGAGVAGSIDAKNGNVRHSPNIKFINSLKLAETLKLSGIKKVKIDNDANCFARAEMMLGQGKSLQNFLALTLGTGIGGGIVLQRKLYRGLNNSGAELGHIVIDGEFLEKRFQKARNTKDNKELGRLLGQAFAGFVNIFEPQAIILGGGVAADKSRHFLPLAKKEMQKYLFEKNVKINILVSKLKNAGALGAALLVI